MLNEKPARESARPQSGQRARDTRWKKGQSGNPRGRPKSDFTLQVLAQQHSIEGLQRLVSIMREEKTKPETVATVVGMIWDRGFGKAPSSLDLRHELSFADEFETFIRELNARKPVNDVLESVKVVEGDPLWIDRKGAEEGLATLLTIANSPVEHRAHEKHRINPDLR